MPSVAFGAFLAAESEAVLLRSTATEPRLRPISASTKAKYLHASLAANVACWDNYIKSVVREFYDRTSDSLDVRYAQAHGLSKAFMLSSTKRFNTPNWDNTRNYIFTSTGYDPLPHWTWKAAKLSAPDVKDFLDEVLRVRHSFAHGFSLPALNWLERTPGQQNLNVESMRKVQKLLLHLAKQTDKGLADHGRTAFPPSAMW